MLYSCKMAFYRIRKNLVVYCFIALQLLLAFSILCTACNISCALQTRLRQLQADTEDPQIRVDVLGDSVAQKQFDYSKFQSLQKVSDCDTGLLTTAIVKANPSKH